MYIGGEDKKKEDATVLLFLLSLSIRVLFCGVSRVSCFPVRSLIFMPKSLLLTLISHATWVSTRVTARGARWGWQGGEGPCVLRRLLHPHKWFYPGLRFNLLSLFLILDPIPAPVPAGD